MRRFIYYYRCYKIRLTLSQSEIESCIKTKMPNISSFEWKIKKRKEGKVNITSIEVIVDTPIETFIKEKKQEHIVSPIITEQKEPVGGSPLAMKPTRVMGPTI